MKPILFKGSNRNSILSNFHPHKLYVPWLLSTWCSVEQPYQYLCALKNGYDQLANQILDLEAGPNTGKDAKDLANLIPSFSKSQEWRNEKCSLIYSLMKLKFEQYTPFRKLLLATDRPLLHPVASGFWGLGKEGNGRNVCGKLLMELRENVQASWGQPRTKVYVVYVLYVIMIDKLKLVICHISFTVINEY